MVLKLPKNREYGFSSFESDVISDGTQTDTQHSALDNQFESDVISDGTQTIAR